MFKYYRIDTLINEANSFLADLGVSLLGSLVGFIGALLIAYYFFNRERNNELTNKIGRQKERLKYFLLLIDNSINIIKKQLDKFEKLAKEIVDEPTEQFELHIIASNDLHRLQNMDSEELFQAYLQIITEYENKLKDYKEIYSSIDFLYLENIQKIQSVEKHFDLLHKDQMYVKEKIEKLSNSIYKWIKDIESENQNFLELGLYNMLIKNHSEYAELIRTRAKLGDYEFHFLNVLREDLSYFKKEKQYNELNDLLVEIYNYLDHIKLNSTIYSNELFDIRKKMNFSLEKLREIYNKINNNEL